MTFQIYMSIKYFRIQNFYSLKYIIFIQNAIQSMPNISNEVSGITDTSTVWCQWFFLTLQYCITETLSIFDIYMHAYVYL